MNGIVTATQAPNEPKAAAAAKECYGRWVQRAKLAEDSEKTRGQEDMGSYPAVWIGDVRKDTASLTVSVRSDTGFEPLHSDVKPDPDCSQFEKLTTPE